MNVNYKNLFFGLVITILQYLIIFPFLKHSITFWNIVIVVAIPLLSWPRKFKGDVYSLWGGFSDNDIYSLFGIYQDARLDAFQIFGISIYQYAGKNASQIIGLIFIQRAGSSDYTGNASQFFGAIYSRKAAANEVHVSFVSLRIFNEDADSRTFLFFPLKKQRYHNVRRFR